MRINKCYDCSSCFIKFWSCERIVRCQIHTLAMKATILRNMQVTVRTFAQLIFNNFSLSLNRRKVMETMRKKQKTVTLPGLQQPIYQILGLERWIGANAGIAKKEGRELDCLCWREVDVISDEKFEGIAERLLLLELWRK